MFRFAHVEGESALVDPDERSFDALSLRDGVPPVSPLISLLCNPVRTEAR